MWNLLAQAGQDDILKEIRWPGQSVTLVIIAVAILGLTVLGYRLVRYFLETVSTGRDGSHALFETLARRHRLTPTEERELVRIASRIGLEDPTMLFVRRSMLEGESARSPGTELDTLVGKLFG